MKQKHSSFNMQMGLWFSVAAILISASSPFSPLLAAPGNDSFGSAVIILSLPYTSPEINTVDATMEPGYDLPLVACTPHLNAGEHSVWYRYTPTANEWIALDTIGTNFDTIIGVYLDESSTLTLVDCDDDSGGQLKSFVNIYLTAGEIYYFVVASFNGNIGEVCTPCDPGGNLVFNVYVNPQRLFLPLIMR